MCVCGSVHDGFQSTVPYVFSVVLATQHLFRKALSGGGAVNRLQVQNSKTSKSLSGVAALNRLQLQISKSPKFPSLQICFRSEVPAGKRAI